MQMLLIVHVYRELVMCGRSMPLEGCLVYPLKFEYASRAVYPACICPTRARLQSDFNRVEWKSSEDVGSSSDTPA